MAKKAAKEVTSKKGAAKETGTKPVKASAKEPAAKAAKASTKEPAAKPVKAVAKDPVKAAAKEPVKAVAKEPVEKAPKKAPKPKKDSVEASGAEVVPKKTAKEKKQEAARVAAAIEADAKWSDYKEKHGKEKAPKYSMTAQFQPNTPLEHSKLGWGFILTNVNDRLEVLFQDGIKVLISNYNSSQKI